MPEEQPNNPPAAPTPDPAHDVKPAEDKAPSANKPATPPANGKTWSAVSHQAATRGKVAALLAAILIAGSSLGLAIDRFYLQPAKPSSGTNQQPVVTTLSPDEIQKLSQAGTTLGTSGQTLTIGANSIFQGNVQVANDLTLAGHLNANGPVSISSLNISGQSTFTTVTVSKDLQVGGSTTLQGGLNASNFLNVNGTLNVNGATSLGSTTISALTVKNITLAGPITVGHVLTTGPNPNATAGTAVGGGGTINISGNDTAGTININTGNNPPAGVLMSVSFRAAFAGRVHVILTASTGAAASLPVYVVATPTGFSIRVDTPPSPGVVYSYDYFVVE